MKNRFYLLTKLRLWFKYHLMSYYYNGPYLIRKHGNVYTQQSLADWLGVPRKARIMYYTSMSYKSFLKDEKERILEERKGREQFLNMTMAQMLTTKV